MSGRSNPQVTASPDGSRLRRWLRWAAVLSACAAPVEPVLGQTAPTLTVQGAGTASRSGDGSFSATLPDGSVCTATFSGGKISLFGQSATKAKATCTVGGVAQPVSGVVHRRLNGSPKEAILTFRDGTKVLVVIPPAVQPVGQ